LVLLKKRYIISVKGTFPSFQLMFFQYTKVFVGFYVPYRPLFSLLYDAFVDLNQFWWFWFKPIWG